MINPYLIIESYIAKYINTLTPAIHDEKIEVKEEEVVIKIEDDSPVTSSMAKSDFWTRENINLLLLYAKKCKRDWKKVSRKFKTKKITPFVVKNKYKELTISNFIKPGARFTHEEDLLIAKYYNIYKTNWDKIASKFKTRNASMIKNRYYLYIRKKDILGDLLKEVSEIESSGKNVDNLLIRCSYN